MKIDKNFMGEKKTPKKHSLKSPPKTSELCGGTDQHCLLQLSQQRISLRVKMREEAASWTQNLLIYHKTWPDHHVLLCVSWFHAIRKNDLVDKIKKRILSSNTPIKWRIVKAQVFFLWCTLLLGGRWSSTHTDNFPLPNSNHRKASLWLIYIQLHYISSDRIWF